MPNPVLLSGVMVCPAVCHSEDITQSVMIYACSESEQTRIRATGLQDELRSLHADHSRLVEQYEVAQSCNAGLQHDLKACKHSLKQVLLLFL